MLFSASWCATLKRREGLVTRPLTLTCTSAEGKSDKKGIESTKYKYNSDYLCSITNCLHLAVVQGHVACNGEDLRLQKLLPLCPAPGCLASGRDPLPSSPCNLYLTRCIRHAGWDTVPEVDELGRCHCSKWRTLSSTIML